MDRRAVVTIVTGKILAAPLTGIAQKPRVPTIGVLVVRAPSSKNGMSRR